MKLAMIYDALLVHKLKLYSNYLKRREHRLYIYTYIYILCHYALE